LHHIFQCLPLLLHELGISKPVLIEPAECTLDRFFGDTLAASWNFALLLLQSVPS
jgi:hypothetical protein